MANRLPLVFDTTDSKIKELPSGDNLSLLSSSIVDVVNIASSGTITANTINVQNLNVTGESIGAAAISNNYYDLDNLPVLFSGDYNDLTNKPSSLGADWNDITNKPIIATKLSQLTNDTNFVANSQVVITVNQVVDIATVAKTNNYNDLNNRITALSQLTNDANYITAEDIAGGTLTVEVNNTGNLVGSVFAEDSSLLVDHLNGTINLANGPVTGSTDMGLPTNRFKSLYIGLEGGSVDFGQNGRVGLGTNYSIFVTGLDIGLTGVDIASVELIRAQLEQTYLNSRATYLEILNGQDPAYGSEFFAEDTLPKLEELQEYEQRISDAHAVLSFDFVNETIKCSAPFEGTFRGVTDGEHIGSVFGDDSTLLVDAISRTHFGNFDGDLTGSVFGDDSTLIVDAQNKNIQAVNVYANTHWGNLSKVGTILSISSNNGIQLLPDGPLSTPNATTIALNASDTISLTATNNLTITSTSGIVSVEGHISIADLQTLVAASTDFANFKSRIAALTP